MKNKVYKVGFIGTGLAAKIHLKALKKLVKENKIPKIQFVGFLQSEDKNQKPSKFGRSYVNFDKFISEEEPDVIYLCTPPFARAQYEKKLIKKGIHYFVEKPPTTIDHQEIIDVLNTPGLNLVIQLGFQWRYFEFNKFLKKELVKDPVAYVLGFRFNPLPFQDWRLDRKKSGGSIYERVIHMIDYCKYIFDEKNIQFLKYVQIESEICRSIDIHSNLNDVESLLFKVKNSLCNISSVSYSQNNDILELNFVGLKNIYKIIADQSGFLRFQVLNNNKIKEEHIENPIKAYEEENLDFWQSIISGRSKTNDYIESLKFSKNLKNFLKN